MFDSIDKIVERSFVNDKKMRCGVYLRKITGK